MAAAIVLTAWCVQGYLAHKKKPPPWDLRRALDMVLLKVPRLRRSLMSEVTLYRGEFGRVDGPIPAWT
jgi:hypothetical protein